MIPYHLDYDAAAWVPVPADDGDGWPEAVVDHYAAELGSLTPALEGALRRVGETALRMRTELTGHLLVFCPVSLAPAIGFIGIQVLEDAETELDAAVKDDPAAVLLPNVETIDDEYWGTGRRAAVVTGSSREDAQGGRFNYAFRRGNSLLVATAFADTIPYATVMQPYADRLVLSVRMEDE
ncbi:hypothetical protein [Microbacterium sp. SSM24]|uniref:hypothetical protein n=1 Tax=Microbacterium sp. SSM24 TaxID=2991714 RepID=UPI0022264A14|nr:hypothetical protein [Microbacterium sp. SSM24]MCW3493213.1 hypothetical protein [Microbacterium sp. SSM24]